MFVNLNRDHIKFFNRAISAFIAEQRNDYIKGKLSDKKVDESRERLEYLRETLHFMGNISISENEYDLIKEYVN